MHDLAARWSIRLGRWSTAAAAVGPRRCALCRCHECLNHLTIIERCFEIGTGWKRHEKAIVMNPKSISVSRSLLSLILLHVMQLVMNFFFRLASPKAVLQHTWVCFGATWVSRNDPSGMTPSVRSVKAQSSACPTREHDLPIRLYKQRRLGSKHPYSHANRLASPTDYFYNIICKNRRHKTKSPETIN